MKAAAALLAVVAWLLATTATAHAVAYDTINFDDPALNGTLLDTQFLARGVSFKRDGCASGAGVFENTLAHSGTQVAAAVCPAEGYWPSDRIEGSLVLVPAMSVSLFVRHPPSDGSSSSQRTASLRVSGGGETVEVTRELSGSAWVEISASLPGQRIRDFAVDVTGDAFFEVDDLTFARDDAPPEIDITQPVEGAVYAQGEAVTADYTCWDYDSGIADPDGCTGSSVDGYAVDTSTVGDHEFVVNARDNAGNTATETVKYKVVETRIALEPTCDESGDEGTYTITVRGLGTDPARRGVLQFSGTDYQKPVDPGADGSFTTEITPPRQDDGFYTVSFHYYERSPYGYEDFQRIGPTVASAVFAVPCPTLEVQPTCGPAATGAPDFYTLNLVGQGFPPESRAVLTFAGEEVGQALVDEGGALTATITPALRPGGTYDITATASTRLPPPFIGTHLPPPPPPGANFDVVAKTTFKVPCDAPPAITIAPGCGDAGETTIRVLGERFAAGQDVELLFDDEAVSEAQSGADGTLDEELFVEDVSDGEHTVSVRYLDEEASEVPPATYTVPCGPRTEKHPSLSVDPKCGPAGLTRVHLTGVDFEPDSAVRLFFDGEPAGSGEVGSDGTLDATLSVADAQPRLHTVTVRYDDDDADAAEANYLVPCAPQVSVTPDCGQAQLPRDSAAHYKIQVTGRGFVPPGHASVSFNGTVVAADVAVAENGTLSEPLEVDALPSGRYEVRVEQHIAVGDGQVRPHVAVTAFTVPCGEVTVTPGCDVPRAGRDGGELYRLRVLGRSFAAGSSVALTFEVPGNGAQATHIAKADADGKLATTFKVPRQPTGTFLVRATIVRGGVPTPSFVASSLTVPCRQPSLAVDPPLGQPGFITTVTGRDFPPNARVHLSWSSGSLGSVRVRTDAEGRLRARMLVFRHDLLGPRVLTARTETGYSKARTDYLVVPGSQQPSGFLVRR